MRFPWARISLPALSQDRKSTRLNSSHSQISYAVFCLKKKKSRVIDAVGDMLFASKIRGTAEHLNVTVEFASCAYALFCVDETEVSSLVILNLHASQLE